MPPGILVMVLLTALALLRSGKSRMIWLVMLLAGGLIEASSTSFTMAISGMTVMALAGTALTGRDRPMLYVLFGSLFLIIFGSSILATQGRTDDFSLLRTALGFSHDSAMVGALLVLWIGFLLRLVLLPILSPHLAEPGDAATVGVGWVSGLVVTTRLGGLFPQALLESSQGILCFIIVPIFVVVGLAAFSTTVWEKRKAYVAAAVGATALWGAWFGGAHGLMGRMLVARMAILLLCLGLMGHVFTWRWRIPVAALRLACIGFPFTAIYFTRRDLLYAVEKPVQIGMAIAWILPLMAMVAHPFPGSRAESERTRGVSLKWIGLVVGSLTIPPGLIERALAWW